MRILHVAESIRGGVGSYLNNLAPLQISAQGSANIRLLVPAEHRDQLEGAALKLAQGYARPDRSIRSLVSLASALRDEVSSFKPDIIHAHSTFAGLIVRPAYGRRNTGPAVVYCPHGWAFDITATPAKRAIYAGIELSLAPFADAVIAISDHERAIAISRGIDPRKLHLIHNGINELNRQASEDPSWRTDKLKVLFIGRLDRQKGLDLLLEAVAPLQDSVSVRVVGEAVAGARQALIASPAAYLGWLDAAAVNVQLASCDVVVVPSRWEGFGLVALEAMRAGKPVIAADVGGLSEVLGDCGWLIAPESPNAIRAALMRMDVATRVELGARGRKRFLAHFTAANMSDQVTRLYDRVRNDRSKAMKPARAGFNKPINRPSPERTPVTLAPVVWDRRDRVASLDEKIG